MESDLSHLAEDVQRVLMQGGPFYTVPTRLDSSCMMGPFYSLKRPPPSPPPQPPFGKENIAAHSVACLFRTELFCNHAELTGFFVCLFAHPVLGITLIDTGRVTLPHNNNKKQPETQLTSDYNHRFSTEMATRHHTLSSGGDLLSKNVGMNCF